MEGGAVSLFDHNLALRRTVEDYANARESALAGYASALRQLSQVRADLAKFGDLLWPYNALPELSLEDVHPGHRSTLVAAGVRPDRDSSLHGCTGAC